MAFLIMVGYGIVALASANREIRFAFPAIVGLSFLTCILISGKAQSAAPRPAALAAGLVFCGMLAAAVPMRIRADRQSLSRPNAVLADAAGCNARIILLDTDSPTLNWDLMELALEVPASGASGRVGQVSTLAYRTVTGVPIEGDFSAISEADLVVFHDSDKLGPPFTNQRVSEYERYVRQAGYVATRVGDDVTACSIHCRL